MSLFKKPKKHIQRRVFGSNEDDEGGEHNNGMGIDEDEKMDIQPVTKVKKKEKKDKDRPQTKQTLLSFGDEGKPFIFYLYLLIFFNYCNLNIMSQHVFNFLILI